MNREKRSLRKKYIGDALTHIVLICIIFCTSLPFLSMLGISLKTSEAALTTKGLFPEKWSDFSVESFVKVLTKTTFGRNMLNSNIVATVVTVTCIVIAALAGYAIARFRGRYFSFYSILLLLLQMFPTMLLLMPLYVLFNKLNLINTMGSVIISYVTMNLAFSIWMLKGFFDSIPAELEQAAMVDGCTQFTAYLKVVIPVSLPGVATVGIFTFINSWNEYTLASIFLRKDQAMTMTVGLQKFVQQNGADWSLLMAASTIATIPTLIFLLFAQRYLIEGMTAGAVKG